MSDGFHVEHPLHTPRGDMEAAERRTYALLAAAAPIMAAYCNTFKGHDLISTSVDYAELLLKEIERRGKL